VDIAVLTNAELDHHATFSSLDELREAFREFLAGAPVAVIWDRPELRQLRAGRAIFYDLAEPHTRDGGSTFDWRGHRVSLSVPGVHNALDALGALETSVLAGADELRAIAGLAAFTGAARRFQLLGKTPRGALVYDDYAHHPTEVAATLAAARTLEPERLVAVFQPHLYSRTALLAEGFGAALAQADAIVLLDVYPARERAEDYPGVSGLTLAHTTEAHAGEHKVLWRASFEQAEAALEDLLEAGDVCVVMGAGDVDALARRLVGGDGV
jgi:UDP-N-acetylmuramate--alanine ligase